MWVWHCVKRPNIQRVFIQNIKVSVVLLFHQFSQEFLVRRRQIIKFSLINTVFLQHFNTFAKVQNQWRIAKFKVGIRKLFENGLNFLSILVSQSPENINKSFTNLLNNL